MREDEAWTLFGLRKSCALTVLEGGLIRAFPSHAQGSNEAFCHPLQI